MVTITRGNDTITLSDDGDPDTVVFQILELTDVGGNFIGPGEDVVNNFTLNDDVLRFIIFDMGGDPSADLIALIDNVVVNTADAVISFDDGSTITLTGSFPAVWDNDKTAFVNAGVADGYIQIFDVTDMIPLA